MQLPFTPEQFLDVFGTYNRAMWPEAAILWLVTVALLVRLLRGGAKASVAFSFLLAAHWRRTTTCLFRAINPAAFLFGVVFSFRRPLAARGFARAPV
jgi:hypothetical protein